MGRARAGTLLLAVCFFLSGFGSLALEVVWTRQLRLVFGSTTLAASTILVAYMLGLGLGGLLGGRVASRLRSGVRAYGWIEIAIGLYALAVPTVLAWFPVVNRMLLHEVAFWSAALVRFALSLLLFLVPTLLMGATLPILVGHLARTDRRIAASAGLLYGVNTLGAVTGVFVATFILFPALGVWRTSLVGAIVDIAVGMIAVLLLPRFVRREAVPGDTVVAAPPSSAVGDTPMDVRPAAPALVLVAYAAVGFAGLVCEVGWMRGLAVVLGSSIYAFAAMLGAFLAGIALGSLLFRSPCESARRPTLLLGCALVALALLSLATTLSLPFLPGLFLRLVAQPKPAELLVVLLQVGVCMLAMLPPTLVLGGLFPLVARIVATSSRDVGSAVGRLYFANTVGAALGAFLAGFVLLPGIGIERTLALAAAVPLAVATPFLVRAAASSFARLAAAVSAVAAAALLVVPLPFDRLEFTRGVFQRPDAHMEFGIAMLPHAGEPSSALLYYQDGINATVSVQRLRGATVLKVNGKVDASNRMDMPNQVLPAHIPLVFGPRARKVLVIGYASGVTVGSVVRHASVERIDVVEIEPAVLEASRFFDVESGTPLADRRVRVILDDGRTWIETTDQKYDVIISEPSNPWLTGVANLFTREFFRAASRALEPDGRLMQWIQLYGMDPPAVAAVIAAMRGEFPFVYGFAHEGDGANLLLLATRRALARDDLPRWETLPPSVKEDLRRVGNFSTADLWSLLRVLPADVDGLARTAAVENSDENLLIELRAPLLANRATMAGNWRVLAPSPAGVLPLLKAVGEPLDDERIGEIAYAYAAKRRDYRVAQHLLGVASEHGRAGHSIAGAVALVRGVDQSGAFTLENQLASLDEAVALAPNALEPVLLRGQVRLEADQPSPALEDSEAALRLAPDDPRPRALHLRALAALGRNDQAAREVGALLGSSFDQYDGTIAQDSAALLVEAGRDDEARQMLEPLLRDHEPDWEDGWRLLATVYERLSRPAAARTALDNADIARQNQTRLLHRMARLALWLHEQRDARSLLELALAQSPEYQPAREDLEKLAATRADARPLP